MRTTFRIAFFAVALKCSALGQLYLLTGSPTPADTRDFVSAIFQIDPGGPVKEVERVALGMQIAVAPELARRSCYRRTRRHRCPLSIFIELPSLRDACCLRLVMRVSSLVGLRTYRAGAKCLNHSSLAR